VSFDLVGVEDLFDAFHFDQCSVRVCHFFSLKIKVISIGLSYS
jgi:hypothetical protein